MKKRLPIGVSDFREMIEDDYYYVDKTLLIQEILTSSFKVLLLPRPRRFGKTLNLSMLRYFLEKSEEKRVSLFDGLAIQKDKYSQSRHGKHPVVWLTFKNVKNNNWTECFNNLKAVISKEFARHRYLQDEKTLFPEELEYFQNILTGKADKTAYERSLENLSEYLRRRFNEKVVILIDEYDTPLHEGYSSNYYDEVVGFTRNLLGGGLKDNEHLFKGVITGILRIAKESIFSGLNNPGVFTLLEEEFNTAFGLTEKEVKSLLDDYDLSDRYHDVASWYNGYKFGGKVVYNPWSVLNFTASKAKEFRPFWINTASTEIIDKLVIREGKELREELGRLLEGKSVEKPIYDSIVMKNLGIHDDLLWSLLLFSGYLKPVKKVDDETYEMMIPNKEVWMIYRGLVKTWFADKVESNLLAEMLTALEDGDVRLFERNLRVVVMRVMSYHDFSGEPEKVYHALVLGMLVWLSGKYEIKSNRESGHGRYDLALTPKNPAKQGVIMEFKRIDEKRKSGKVEKWESGKAKGAPGKTLDEALEQIEARQYDTEMIAAGVKDILKLAIAFKGKELWVKKKRMTNNRNH